MHVCKMNPLVCGYVYLCNAYVGQRRLLTVYFFHLMFRDSLSCSRLAYLADHQSSWIQLSTNPRAGFEGMCSRALLLDGCWRFELSSSCLPSEPPPKFLFQDVFNLHLFIPMLSTPLIWMDGDNLYFLPVHGKEEFLLEGLRRNKPRPEQHSSMVTDRLLSHGGR